MPVRAVTIDVCYSTRVYVEVDDEGHVLRVRVNDEGAEVDRQATLDLNDDGEGKTAAEIESAIAAAEDGEWPAWEFGVWS